MIARETQDNDQVLATESDLRLAKTEEPDNHDIGDIHEMEDDDNGEYGQPLVGLDTIGDSDINDIS